MLSKGNMVDAFVAILVNFIIEATGKRHDLLDFNRFPCPDVGLSMQQVAGWRFRFPIAVLHWIIILECLQWRLISRNAMECSACEEITSCAMDQKETKLSCTGQPLLLQFRGGSMSFGPFGQTSF